MKEIYCPDCRKPFGTNETMFRVHMEIEHNKKVFEIDTEGKEYQSFVFEKSKESWTVLGQVGEGKAFRLDADKVIIKELQRYKSNNWLKMHGIPMRRKPMKREKQVFVTDEFYKMFDL